MATTAAATRSSATVLSIPNYGSASPSRVKLPTARSPAKTLSVSSPPAPSADVKSRRSCMCSPTNHPGSFRCSLHKDHKPAPAPASGGHVHNKPASPPAPPAPAVFSTGAGVGSRLLARKAIARSRQSPQRRFVAGGGSFLPRASRLSAASFAGDNRQ